MRILQHDLVGYAFTVDLARELARRGHQVDYVYCASITTNPRGPVEARPDDPPTLRFHPITLAAPLDKQSLVRRYRQERAYGRLLADLVPRLRPEVVLSSNAPLDAQAPLLAAAERAGVPFVFWLQDLIGEATDRLLRGRIPVVGAAAGRHYKRLEADLLRRSSAVIAISEDFRPYLDAAGVTCPVEVIENWAPIADIPVRPKVNPWSVAHGLHDKFVFLYAGTLGRKHDPMLLVELAECFREDPETRVVLVSEGAAVEAVRAEAKARGLANIVVLRFARNHQLPDVLAAGDVLLTLLEPDAGLFSVPSKLLSQLCAGRAILASMSAENSAARLVHGSGSALVVAPERPRDWLDAARRLRADHMLRHNLGEAARVLAERRDGDHAERCIETILRCRAWRPCYCDPTASSMSSSSRSQ